jgi:hypothetical protein
VTDNSTASGAYRVYQAGAGTSSATAAALAGYGIKAITTTLNQEYPTVSYSTTPQTMTTAQRAALVIWTGGAGIINFSAPATLTTGWFVNIVNQGTGAIVLTPPSGKIDGVATKTLQVTDSCTVITDGTNFYSVGFGQDPLLAFTYTTVSLTGVVSPYYLATTPANLTYTAIKFTGTLTADMDVVVPNTVQQFWTDNSTVGTSTYVFGFRTATQVSPGVAITNDAVSSRREILYCNGTSVVDSFTNGLSSPVAVSAGGTSAITASSAQKNLNVPSTLDAFSYVQMFS